MKYDRVGVLFSEDYYEMSIWNKMSIKVVSSTISKSSKLELLNNLQNI